MAYTVISVPNKVKASNDLMPRADSTYKERMGVVDPSVNAAGNASVIQSRVPPTPVDAYMPIFIPVPISPCAWSLSTP